MESPELALALALPAPSFFLELFLFLALDSPAAGFLVLSFFLVLTKLSACLPSLFGLRRLYFMCVLISLVSFRFLTTLQVPPKIPREVSEMFMFKAPLKLGLKMEDINWLELRAA